MILFKTAADLSNFLSARRVSGDKIGFVPTMGALHKGHLSLISASRGSSSLTVCSIFVNPTQFNDPVDFQKYPVTIEQDILLLERAGCDVLFLPAVDEIYPDGTESLPHFELGNLEKVLEGHFRPGHFQGVCQVVYRLLEIVRPSFLFLGQKDLQQCMVIRRMIQLTGWNMETVIVPTVREISGLAMSSRNTRLSEENRQRATAIYKALQYLQESIEPGDVTGIIAKAEKSILDAGFSKTDYVVIADAATLEILTEWNGQTPVAALVAAFIQDVRLIDNRMLTTRHIG